MAGLYAYPANFAENHVDGVQQPTVAHMFERCDCSTMPFTGKHKPMDSSGKLRVEDSTSMKA
jgi:hypothetical protein